MNLPRRAILTALSATVGLLGLEAYFAGGATAQAPSATSSQAPTDAKLVLDSAAQHHDADHKVYHQLGLRYVATPQASDYETLGIYVSGAYFTGKDSDSGTHMAAVNTLGTVGSFITTTIPTILPINALGYPAQKPPTEYSYDTIKAYMEAGFICVYVGLRGKDSNSQTYSGNAPWDVADPRAAVRYRRCNSTAVPGGTTKVHVFGHSGGGAQNTVARVSRDSELFAPYPAAPGAATTDTSGKILSDAVTGAMCWCLITSLDNTNAAYKWNMGQFASPDTRAEGTWAQAYSRGLVAAFLAYPNGLKFINAQGKPLTLKSFSQDTYLSGFYYNHLVSVIQKSLNNFLAAITFSYTSFSTEMAGIEPSGGNGAPSGALPSDAGGTPPRDGIPGGDSQSSAESTTYRTVEEYIAFLSFPSQRIIYDAPKKIATITGLQGFVTSRKNASKDVGTLDGMGHARTENPVMGSGESKQHFPSLGYKVISRGQSRYSGLSGWNRDYGVAAYEKDLAAEDSVGAGMITRVAMYDPLYYPTRGSKGRGSSTIVPAQRVRTSITQDDTASTVEASLTLALQQAGIGNVSFITTWGQGYAVAELTGTGGGNFITWVTKQAS